MLGQNYIPDGEDGDGAFGLTCVRASALALKCGTDHVFPALVRLPRRRWHRSVRSDAARGTGW